MSFWNQGIATRRVLLGCALIITLFSMVFVLLVWDLRQMVVTFKSAEPDQPRATEKDKTWTVEDQILQDFKVSVSLSKTREILLEESHAVDWEKVVTQYLDTGAVLIGGKRFPLPDNWEIELHQATEKASSLMQKLAQDPLPEPVSLERLPSVESWDRIYPYQEVLWSYRLLLARAAVDLNQGNPETMFQLDQSLPWLSRALLLEMDHAVSLMGGIFEYHLFDMISPFLQKLYLRKTISDPVRYETALMRRNRYLNRWCPLAGVFQAEWRYMDVIYNIRMKKDHYWSLTLLELWYGHPGRPVQAMQAAVKNAESQGVTAMAKAWEDEYDRQFRALKNMKTPWDWLELLRVHPLSAISMPSYNRILQDMGKTYAEHHLITLGGFARLWFLREGSWPSPEDPGFVQQAGTAALDPMDRKPLRFDPQPDGTLQLYSVGINGNDDKGREDDIVVTVERP